MRSSRLIFAAFAKCSSNNTLIKAPIQQSSLSTTKFHSNFSINKSTISHFSPPNFNKPLFTLFLNNHSNIFSKPSLINKSTTSNFHTLPIPNKSIQLRRSPFPNARFYSSTTNNPKNGFKKWIACLLLYVVATSYTELFIRDEKYLEKVPFTNRTHYVIYSPASEREIGLKNGRYLRLKYYGKILHDRHPKHIRVQRVANDLMTGLHVGLNDVKYDDRKCLEGLLWEFLVVDDPVKNAWYYPGGKIVISTGFLESMSSDVELAWVLAHEIAHVVARHPIELRSKFKWRESVKKSLERVWSEDNVDALGSVLRSPLRVRIDKEADRIALLLLAFAGYDPQIGPKMIRKHLGALHYRNFFVRRANFMDKAVKIYKMRSVETSDTLPDTTFAISKHE